MQTQTFNRKPHDPVQAVQVTEENLDEVSAWCGGQIHKDTRGRYIQVPVVRPINDRQIKAYVGDWVLSSKTGFKSYQDKPFHENFNSANSSDAEGYASPDDGVVLDAQPVSDSFTANVFNPGGMSAADIHANVVAAHDVISGKRGRGYNRNRI